MILLSFSGPLVHVNGPHDLLYVSTKDLRNLALQQNLWVKIGSGRSPSV